MSYDLPFIKSMLPEYLERSGISITKRTATHLECLCPLHQDGNPSFTADLVAGVWVWKCWPCGTGGTVIDLHARLNGLDAKSFDCIKEAAEALQISPDERYQVPRVSPIERGQRRRDAEETAKQDALTKHLNQRLAEKLDYFSHHHWFPDWRDALDEGTLITLKDRRHDSRLFIESLFQDDEIVWMGETYESGREENRHNFRPVSDWLELDQLPPRVAAGTFHRGSISRNSESVDNSPFIVIESDDLIGHEPRDEKERDQNKAASFALFFYCQEKLGLHPRAVIDTGNKSLHLWFDRPPPDEFSALLKLADGLRIDRGLLERCQCSPLRLPGTIHEKTNNPAELYFINPKHDSNSK